MRKIRYLDGLRGLAAFEVVIHHFVLAFYPALFSGPEKMLHLKAGVEDLASRSVLNLPYSGNFAVCIFFVLSGYVLSRKFFMLKDNEIITASAVKRYLRLAIPVAFSVFCAYVLMKFSLFYNQQAADVSGSDWLAGFWSFEPDFMDAVSQAFTGTFFTDIFDYNMTLWTIAFEFFGSFLVFGFLALFGKMKNRHWAYVIAIVIFFQTYYLAFILGMLLSDLKEQKDTIIKNFDRAKLLRTGLLLLGLFLGSYPSGRDVIGTIYAPMFTIYFTDPAIVYHVLGAFLVILVLLASKSMQKLFSFKFFLFLGEISFSMYLLHFIILGSFSSFVFLKLAPRLPYTEAVIVTFILSVGLIFLASYLMNVYVDKKAVSFSRKVYLCLFKQA